MNRTTRRLLLGLVAVLPTLVAAAVIRPVAAIGDEGPLGFYAVEARAAGLGVEGEIGAGGGLAPVDPAVSVVRSRLDSAPAATSTAAAVEPGTLYRTVAAVGNDSAGRAVVPAPLAQANYPGEPEGSADLLGSQDLGPAAASGMTARATADRDRVGGTSEVGSLRVHDAPVAAARLWRELDSLRLRYPGVFAAAAERSASAIAVEGVRGGVDAVVNTTADVLTATSTSTLDRVTILSEIELRGVVGEARVEIGPDGRTPTATIDVASATIAGVAVEISEEGVTVADTAVADDGAVTDVTAALNGALAAAGVELSLATPVVDEPDERTAEADSRGVRVRLASPALADGGVPANEVVLIFGGARVVTTDEPARGRPVVDTPVPAASPTPTPAASPAAPAPPSAPSSGPTVAVPPVAPAPTTPATPEVAPDPEPSTAPPVPAAAPEPAQVLVAGQPWTATTAISVLAVFQLLSLGGTTAAVTWMIRRGAL